MLLDVLVLWTVPQNGLFERKGKRNRVPEAVGVGEQLSVHCWSADGDSPTIVGVGVQEGGQGRANICPWADSISISRWLASHLVHVFLSYAQDASHSQPQPSFTLSRRIRKQITENAHHDCHKQDSTPVFQDKP
jgi:hypothetical protein